MTKALILILTFSISSNLQGQSVGIDTVVVHNSFCSLGNFSWGHHDSFYPPKKCPRKKRKDYLKEHNIWSVVSTNKVYWIKVYDIKDRLIYEGLCYSDCTIGPFKSYHLNGNVRLEGSFNGFSFDPEKGYVFIDCNMTKKGEWNEFDEAGNLIKKEIYP